MVRRLVWGVGSKQRRDMIWFIFLKEHFGCPLEDIIKIKSSPRTEHTTSLGARQWKVLDTCFYYCFCVSPAEVYPAVLQSHQSSGPLLEELLWHLLSDQLMLGGDCIWLPLLPDRTHFQSTAHISQLEYAWLTAFQLRHSLSNRRTRRTQAMTLPRWDTCSLCKC